MTNWWCLWYFIYTLTRCFVLNELHIREKNVYHETLVWKHCNKGQDFIYWTKLDNGRTAHIVLQPISNWSGLTFCEYADKGGLSNGGCNFCLQMFMPITNNVEVFYKEYLLREVCVRTNKRIQQMCEDKRDFGHLLISLVWARTRDNFYLEDWLTIGRWLAWLFRVTRDNVSRLILSLIFSAANYDCPINKLSLMTRQNKWLKPAQCPNFTMWCTWVLLICRRAQWGFLAQTYPSGSLWLS